jgi:hypothetical protein
MGFKSIFGKAARSIAREAKEGLPNVASEMSQQILEAAPMWDQGWAGRAQGNRTALQISQAVSETQPAAPSEGVEKQLESIDMHMAALVKSNSELLEMQKEHMRKKEPPKKRRGRR